MFSNEHRSKGGCVLGATGAGGRGPFGERPDDLGDAAGTRDPGFLPPDRRPSVEVHRPGPRGSRARAA